MQMQRALKFFAPSGAQIGGRCKPVHDRHCRIPDRDMGLSCRTADPNSAV
jgi:hypothetical protein